MEGQFRTVELSSPELERDHLRFLTVKSKNLKGRGDVCLFVPPGLLPHDDVPVVILLHGVYGSAWSWAFKTGIHLHAMNWIREGVIPPMVIAMPSDGLWGDGSGYLKHNGFDFEKWIAEDIPALLKQYVPGVTAGSPFFISGLSMGGYGALRIAAKYAHLFRAVSAHSSITSLEQMKLFVEEELSSYLQEQARDEDALQTILHNRENLPAIRFDCGTADELIDANRELHRQLQAHTIAHEYEEFPGGHEWPYWEEHVRKSLEFFKKRILRG